MPFNINEFQAALKFGGARSELFQVIINNPVDTIGDVLTPFLCKAAQVPGSTLKTTEVPYFGRNVKLAGNREFPEWTVTILSDEDFAIRNALEKWSGNINKHEQNIRDFGSGSPLQYKSDASVTQLSKTGVPLRVYKLNGIWPSEIAPIDLSWDAEGVQEFTVTFQIDYWTVAGPTGDAGGA